MNLITLQLPLGGSSGVEPMYRLFEKYEFKGPVNPIDPLDKKDPRWDNFVYSVGKSVGNSIFNSWPNSPTPNKISSTELATVNGCNLKNWADYGTVAGFNENRCFCWSVPQNEMNINDVITQNPGFIK